MDTKIDIQAALKWAAYRGHLEIVRLLLDRGADVHASNDYALCWAANNGHLEVVRLLLERGANVQNMLHLRIGWAHPKIAEFLANYKNLREPTNSSTMEAYDNKKRYNPFNYLSKFFNNISRFFTKKV